MLSCEFEICKWCGERNDVILQGEHLKISQVHVKKSFYRHLQTIWEELRYDEILVKCFLYGRVDLCVSSFLKTCEEKKTFRTDCNGFKYKYVDFWSAFIMNFVENRIQ